MEGIATLLSSNWGVFLSIVGLIIWAARLQERVNQGDRDHQSTEKRIDILSVKHDQLDSKMVEQLSDVKESLARIEGALGVQKPHHNER